LCSKIRWKSVPRATGKRLMGCPEEFSLSSTLRTFRKGKCTECTTSWETFIERKLSEIRRCLLSRLIRSRMGDSCVCVSGRFAGFGRYSYPTTHHHLSSYPKTLKAIAISSASTLPHHTHEHPMNLRAWERADPNQFSGAEVGLEATPSIDLRPQFFRLHIATSLLRNRPPPRCFESRIFEYLSVAWTSQSSPPSQSSLADYQYHLDSPPALLVGSTSSTHHKSRL
jgi:hypothetical protein